MVILRWLKHYVPNRIVAEILQAATWACIAVHEWREQRDGLYFWLTLLLVAFSVYILRLEIITRMKNPRTQQPR